MNAYWTAPRASSDWWRDGLAIAFLVATAISLSPPYIYAPGVATDIYSFLREAYNGDMPWGYLQSHRPFRTITWNVATFASGYSKFGLHVVAIVLHLLCSIMVYAIILQLLPFFRSLALAAAALRLTWTTHILEGFDDLIIEALFPEFLFLLSTFLLLSINKDQPGSYFLWSARLVMALLLFVAMGMYEQVWANIVLLPIILVISRAVSLRNNRSLLNLAVWYGAAAAFVILYVVYFDNYGKPPTTLEQPGKYLAIWLTITQVISFDAVQHLLSATKLLAGTSRIWIPLALTFIFCCLYKLFERSQPIPNYSAPNTSRVFAAAAVWLSLSYIHIVVGLASNYGDVVTWGSRFVLSTSYPVIFLIIATALLSVGFLDRGLRTAGLRTASWGLPAIIASIYFVNTSLIVQGWKSIVPRGYYFEHIHRELTKAVPSVEPGTVLLIEGSGLLADVEGAKRDGDIIHTFCMRNLYGIDNAYVLFTTQHFPTIETKDTVKIETALVYPHSLENQPGYTGIGANDRYFHPQLWREVYDGVDTKWITIDKEYIVHLRYRHGSFEIIESESNLSRVKQSLDDLRDRILGSDARLVSPRAIKNT